MDDVGRRGRECRGPGGGEEGEEREEDNDLTRGEAHEDSKQQEESV